MIDTSDGPRRVGAIFDRSRPPEQIAEYARAVEELGADDLWFVEDLRWAGSVASAATALAATRSVRVGIGIAPAPLRSPALPAMEIAVERRGRHRGAAPGRRRADGVPRQDPDGAACIRRLIRCGYRSPCRCAVSLRQRRFVMPSA